MKKLMLIGLLSILGCSPHVSHIAESENNSTSSSIVPAAPPASPPVNSTKFEYTAKITELARTSTCANTNWANRGRSPAGYMKGITLNYARSLCRSKSSTAQAASAILKNPSSGNKTKDVLAHYQDLLANIGIQVNQSGVPALQAAYTVGIGLAMRESSGKYCEGWDTSAGANRPSAADEAGLFQVSYDSIGRRLN